MGMSIEGGKFKPAHYDPYAQTKLCPKYCTAISRNGEVAISANYRMFLCLVITNLK